MLYFLPVCSAFIFENQINQFYDPNSYLIAYLLTFYFYMIFSKILLKEKIYKHRVISIIIMTICLFIFLLGDVFHIKSFLFFLFYEFSITGINALFSVLVKIHFNTYLTDPYLLVFCLGLYTLLILIPFEIIYHFFFSGNSIIL